MTSVQAIKALSEKFHDTKAKVAPKSRFAFKTKSKNNLALSITGAPELASENCQDVKANLFPTESFLGTTPALLMMPAGQPAGSTKDNLNGLPTFGKDYNNELGISPLTKSIRKPSFSQATNVSLSGHTALHIILPSSASHATSSGSLTNLNRCIVDMSVPTANGAPFAGLALKNIKHSLIVAGHVAGAAHITAVKDSIIVVASRQVRMHECKNVDIYLLCASRPIIEDCSNVRFSPMPDCFVCLQLDINFDDDANTLGLTFRAIGEESLG